MEEEKETTETTEETQGNESEMTQETNTVIEDGDNTNVEVTNTEPEEQTVEEPVVTEPTVHEDEHKFTQADIDNAVKKALAKKLPPKKEMDEFKAWKEAQKTEQEKAAEREQHYLKIEQENEALKNENAVIKAGVRAEDVDYVLFKVGKMEGDDFEDNLKSFLETNSKFTAPKTKTVEGAKHETKQKETITKAELQNMSYKEKMEFYDKNPEAYENAMRGK